jgi:hypothetical protein
MTDHEDGRGVTRRAVYALAELVWQSWPVIQVSTEASILHGPARVVVHPRTPPTAAAAEDMARALPGVTVTSVEYRRHGETTWLNATGTWQDQAVVLTLFHHCEEA